MNIKPSEIIRERLSCMPLRSTARNAVFLLCKRTSKEVDQFYDKISAEFTDKFPEENRFIADLSWDKSILGILEFT